MPVLQHPLGRACSGWWGQSWKVGRSGEARQGLGRGREKEIVQKMVGAHEVPSAAPLGHSRKGSCGGPIPEG